jgi:hypothetical protein
MNPEIDPHQVIHLLTQYSRPLDNETLSTLAQAREKALGKKTESSSWMIAGHVFSLPHPPYIQHQWLIAGLFAATLLIGIDVWQDTQDQQNCDIDVAILTDELPLEAFVDID